MSDGDDVKQTKIPDHSKLNNMNQEELSCSDDMISRSKFS